VRNQVLVVLAIATALAQPSDAVDIGVVESHCVVDVTARSSTGQLLLSESRCYSTFAEAMFDASAGSLALPPPTQSDVLEGDKEFAAEVLSLILGIHFDGANGSGSSITITGSGCNGGWWNTGASWANRISSSYNGCARLAHYDFPNKGGSVESTYGVGTTDNLGLLNNRAESVAYHSG